MARLHPTKSLSAREPAGARRRGIRKAQNRAVVACALRAAAGARTKHVEAERRRLRVPRRAVEGAQAERLRSAGDRDAGVLGPVVEDDVRWADYAHGIPRAFAVRGRLYAQPNLVIVQGDTS